jgi:hypothetical protein
MTYQEVWYVVQVSSKGWDDWASESDKTYDTLDTIQVELARIRKGNLGEVFDFRLVKKTLTEEPVREDA